ncbi:MAG: c-type cytochrome [Rhodoferax sp.]
MSANHSESKSLWRRMAAPALICGLLLSGSLAFAQADQARAKKIVSGVCFLCHGTDGASASEVFPRLAGQHWEYIAKQLENFKTGKRTSTAMADMVAKLTPDEMVALGKYFEKFPPGKEEPKDLPLANVGEYIFLHGNRYSGVAACSSCHGKDGGGTAQLPRLAGQHAAYLESQLKNFSSRARNNDNAVMHSIVSKMTPLEMAAVSEYLSAR